VSADIIVGHDGVAVVGHEGKATASDYGADVAASRGEATAGRFSAGVVRNGGQICIAYHDGQRLRLAVGYIGEGGLLPGVAYYVREEEA
jgi:hypothetical protein